MKNAEDVTFGGSGWDRSAQNRDQSAALQCQPDARTILLWRGKPMLQDNTVLRVGLDHPVMVDAAADLIYLGGGAQSPLFAADLSDWTPEDLDLTHLDRFIDPSEQRHPALPDARFAELRTVMTHLSPLDAELAATARAIISWHGSHGFCAKCGGQSKAVQGGWRRECPACGAHHFPRTDPVVIMLITHGNSVLLGRSPGWPDGMYSLLAGFVEPGETIEAAVRREVLEETGVQVARVDYLASQPWPFPASLMIGCAGQATTTDIVIDPVEIDDAKWVSREGLARAFAGEDPDLLPARKGAIAHFLLAAWLADRLD